MNADKHRCTGRPVVFVCIEVCVGAHDSIPINNIRFYFIINIFPSGHGGNAPHPKHNYANMTAAGQHQGAASCCRLMVSISPGVGEQDR